MRKGENMSEELKYAQKQLRGSINSEHYNNTLEDKIEDSGKRALSQYKRECVIWQRKK